MHILHVTMKSVSFESQTVSRASTSRKSLGDGPNSCCPLHGLLLLRMLLALSQDIGLAKAAHSKMFI